MPEIKPQKTNNFQFRAKLPLIVRGLAVLGLAVTVFAIAFSFYMGRNNHEFRMKGFPAELSSDVVAEVVGYERREVEGDLVKYYIKADKARTFTDNHHELENAFLQVFDETGKKSDKISAAKAIYIPATDGSKHFTAYFAGNVDIETRDALKVETEQLAYNNQTEIADADEYIEFARENVSGKSVGAVVKIRDQTIELIKDVEIVSSDTNGGAQTNSGSERARIKAGHGFFDQQRGEIKFDQNVAINVVPNNNENGFAQPTDIKAERATAFFVNKELNKIDLDGNVDVYQKPTVTSAKWTKAKANRAVASIAKELKQLELFENVDIETTNNDSQPTKIKTNYAFYEKDSDKFELKNAVEIVTVQDNQTTRITSTDAVYEQSNNKIFLNGAAEIVQGNDFLKGDNLTAELFPNKKLKKAFVKGNAYLKQISPEQTTEVSGSEINAFFGENQQLQSANAIGSSSAILIPAQSAEYSKINISAPKAIRLNFRASGLLEQMLTEGRTTIALNAPNNKPNSANKKLTADSIKSVFHENGKDLAVAEAVGNAELNVEPLRVAPEIYRTTINAARFDCAFSEKGNNAKACVAGGNAKAVRIPTVPSENHGRQNFSADKLTADFNQQTQDIENFGASGNAKFSELDRNGIADRVTFAAGSEIIQLRGGEPTVWDSSARAKASEIDWNTKTEKSNLRGKVSTTYYSQKQTGGATPFGQTNAPVFMTAETAEFDHRAETAIYRGNARAWQENNYVRADELVINEKEGKLFGSGAVQSLLYNAKQKSNGKETSVPVYAAAQKLFYTKDKNVLRYETDVDIRQGTDRISAGVANVYLDDKNEVSQTVAENNVVITQPKRRAAGDYAQYNVAEESIILRGNPANIEDSENGSSQGAQVTVSLKDKRVVSESKTNQVNTGRIRTVIKIKKQ
jgi:LPS export ABC transporter protein LptC/lipopolysaccharide transport protein LptA